MSSTKNYRDIFNEPLQVWLPKTMSIKQVLDRALVPLMIVFL